MLSFFLCLAFLLKVLGCSVFCFVLMLLLDFINKRCVDRMPNQLYMLAASVPLHVLESLRPLCPFLRPLCPLQSLRPLCPCLQCLRPLCPCMVWRCLESLHAYNACGPCALACFEELAAPVPMLTMLAALVPLHVLKSLRPLCPCFFRLAAPVHLNAGHQKFYEGPKN